MTCTKCQSKMIRTPRDITNTLYSFKKSIYVYGYSGFVPI